MKTTIEAERWGWIAPIINKKLSYAEVLRLCPHSKRSLERWVAEYRKRGLSGLRVQSTAPKTQPHETPIRIKEEVITLRKQTGLCALKLHWRLKKQGLPVPRSTIAKILKDEGLVRKYRTKKVKYTYLRAERQPGELMEMDVKYVPGAIQGLKYYQYTVIDTATRWRHLEVFDGQSTYHAIRMMEMVKEKFRAKGTF
jgi:transposase